MFVIRGGSFLFVCGYVLSSCVPVATCDEPEFGLVESFAIRESAEDVLSTDIVHYRDKWVCVLATASDLRFIESVDGRAWRQTSVIASEKPGFPFQDPRLSVTTDGRIMLTAVRSEAPVGGQSLSWFSYDAVEWKEPVASADRHYLISNVFWHVGVAYSLQRGSICGGATTLRIGTSHDHGQTFIDRYEKTFTGVWPGRGALVFSQDDGYCVCAGMIGKSRAPFTYWNWTKLPQRLSSPNAVRAADGTMLVVAGRRADDDVMVTGVCRLDPESVTVVPIAQIPVIGSGFAGLANDGRDVVMTHHTGGGGGSVVYLSRLSKQNHLD